MGTEPTQRTGGGLGEPAIGPEIDSKLVGEVLDLMRRLARDGMTMVVVTHEIGLAREVGDQLVFLDDGVVVETGDPREVVAKPRDERTRSSLSDVL